MHTFAVWHTQKREMISKKKCPGKRPGIKNIMSED